MSAVIRCCAFPVPIAVTCDVPPLLKVNPLTDVPMLMSVWAAAAVLVRLLVVVMLPIVMSASSGVLRPLVTLGKIAVAPTALGMLASTQLAVLFHVAVPDVATKFSARAAASQTTN